MVRREEREAEWEEEKLRYQCVYIIGLGGKCTKREGDVERERRRDVQRDVEHKRDGLRESKREMR